jgi:hypothetical protein
VKAETFLQQLRLQGFEISAIGDDGSLTALDPTLLDGATHINLLCEKRYSRAA